MGRVQRFCTTAATAVLAMAGVVGPGGGVAAEAYGGDGHMDVYQVGVSFNCNNAAFCGSENLGGFWGWGEFDHNPATGANTGDAELTGCAHGTFNGAVHISEEITSWYVAAGSAGPRTIYATGVDSVRFRGHTDQEPFADSDTGVPAAAGHYSTSQIFGFTPPPGVSAQIQVAYKPAH